MKIITKQDLFFKLFYLFLPLMTGMFLALYSRKIVFLKGTVIFLIFFALFMFRKSLRRAKAVRAALPDIWKQIIKKYSVFYRVLDVEEKRQFENDIKIFLKEFNITAAGSVEIDIETKLLIAIGVATILHGRKEWEPPFKDGVVVYPGETFDTDFRFNRGEIAGMAGERRPLLITKDILKKSFENYSDGYNSLLHEIAHYFDFENRGLSGVPLIGNSAENSLKWKNAIENERAKIANGSSFLRSYGGVNDSEFFAVATEFFFERPEDMFNKNKELYFLLKEFYNIDMKEYYKKLN